MIFAIFTALLAASLSLATPLETRAITGVRIHPGGDFDHCLVPAGGDLHNNVAVVLEPCNNTLIKDLRWNIRLFTTNVTVVNSVFALDSGTTPKNGDLAKIYKGYPGIPAQTWYYTPDNRISLKDQGFCIDLKDGKKTLGATIQLWHCTTGNANQVWALGTDS